MNELLLWGAQNTVAAILLAIAVYVLTRAWSHPPTAHLLWLLVLLRLVAPPLVPIEWPAAPVPDAATELTPVTPFEPTAAGPDVGGQFVQDEVLPDDLPVSSLTVTPIASAERFHIARQTANWWSIVEGVLVWLWFGGAAAWGLVTVVRIGRFERLLRNTLPASRRNDELTREIAVRLGVRRAPEVRYAQFADVPMVWCAGLRPKIVLPLGLVSSISEDRLALILAHELAHLRRRDHWVRMVELFVVTLYWWNPLVWLVRRQIHQAEDLCCDAWVRWAFPEQTHRYAEVIFETADRLGASKFGQRLIPASPFFGSTSLKARIEMILHGRFAPNLSRKSKWLVALCALVVVPSVTLSVKGEGRDADASTTKTEQKPTSFAGLELPHAVRFEQGARRFADGDTIRITEIRGTAETFAPGNIYRIKGTYTLASHDGATLAAYTTAREAKDGRGVSYKVQTTTVDKGTGAFTLYLPMSCRGWPHVSFYPVDGGDSFGGNYFGTGDSTLKEWWGTKNSSQSPTTSASAALGFIAANQQPPKITVTHPQFKDVTLILPFVGQIHSQRHIKVRALEKGYLEAIKIREGQQVKAGETLFKVLPILYQTKADAEQAEATLAKIELNGVQKNYEDKVVSKDHVARYEAKLAKAQANADLARAELGFATVKAPYDGIVGRLQYQEGSLVLEGDVLTTLSDNSVMWVYFNVPETLYLEYMQGQEGQDVKIELVLANGKKFDQNGKLGAIEADFNETGNIPFRADFPNPNRILRHGQSGTVRISRLLRHALVIPQRAAFEVGGKRYVYVVGQDNVAQRREIAVQNEVDDVFVIAAGSIGPEDKIILDGVRQALDGEKVNDEGG